MRSIHLLYALVIALFLASIGLYITSVRNARTAEPPVTPVANVQQIMNGLTVPASEVVFKAVSTVRSSRGVEEIAPKNDEEWQAIENSAAMLVESGNLLMIGDRVRDRREWIEMSRAMIDASKVALEAARRKKADALFSSFDAIYLSCERCHLKYFK
jgi:hypothetical protein